MAKGPLGLPALPLSTAIVDTRRCHSRFRYVRVSGFQCIRHNPALTCAMQFKPAVNQLTGGFVMKWLSSLLSLGLIAGLAAGIADAQRRSAGFPSGTIVDLSYAFDSETVYWPTAETFHLEKDFAGTTEKGFYYSAYKYSAAEHGGTHIDAPVHFAEGHQSVDQIPLDQLLGPGIVVDITKQSEGNPDYLITIQDLLAWEKKNGKIAVGTIVLLRTGFGKYYPDSKKYMGTDERGPAAVARLHFPGLHPDAARWLVGNRS